MDKAQQTLDPWLRTIALLKLLCSRLEEATNVDSQSCRCSCTMHEQHEWVIHDLQQIEDFKLADQLDIRVLERPTPGTAIISWSEPGRCHYGCQTWRLVRARHAGTCAISHRPIARGAMVFRPGKAPVPLHNSEAMI